MFAVANEEICKDKNIVVINSSSIYELITSLYPKNNTLFFKPYYKIERKIYNDKSYLVFTGYELFCTPIYFIIDDEFNLSIYIYDTEDRYDKINYRAKKFLEEVIDKYVSVFEIFDRYNYLSINDLQFIFENFKNLCVTHPMLKNNEFLFSIKGDIHIHRFLKDEFKIDAKNISLPG